MSTPLDTVIVPLAKRLIDKYGLQAIFKHTAVGDYDPTTGLGTPDTTEYSITIVPPLPYEKHLVDHDLIRAGDSLTYFAAADIPSGFVPREGMRMVLGTQEWVVVGLNEIRSGEDIALYEVQLRK